MHCGMPELMFEIVWHVSCNVTRRHRFITLLLGGYAMDKLKRFMKDEEGVTAIEYGLIAALIAVVIIAAVTLVGDQLALVFDRIQAALAAALA